MPRLFTGLELPLSIKQPLLHTQRGVSGARWQMADQLHLTLNFLGGVEDASLQDIRQALTDLPAIALEIAVMGVGCFGTPKHPRALWAGVAPEAPLADLHRKINGRLEAFGCEPETRPYKPHVTLARFPASGGGSVEQFLAEHNRLTTSSFTVEQVSLFESIQGQAGSRYRIIDRFALAGDREGRERGGHQPSASKS